MLHFFTTLHLREVRLGEYKQHQLQILDRMFEVQKNGEALVLWTLSVAH